MVFNDLKTEIGYDYRLPGNAADEFEFFTDVFVYLFPLLLSQTNVVSHVQLTHVV